MNGDFDRQRKISGKQGKEFLLKICDWKTAIAIVKENARRPMELSDVSAIEKLL